jgi:predicted dehydrogenase
LENLHGLGVSALALVEPNAERRKHHQGEVFDSLEDGLRWQPQTVVIASPTDQHATQAFAAAEKGCHLFIEKPLSHTLQSLDTLRTEVAARNLVTLVGCNMRFHPGPAMIKRLLEDQAIGQVVAARFQTGSWLPQWRPTVDYRKSYSASMESGGAILDCIHELDLAFWMFGSARLAASAHLPASTLGLQTDGLAEILLAHATGVLSSVHLNFVQRDYRRTCQVIGTEGTIYWDYSEKRVWIHDESGQATRVFPQAPTWEPNQMYVDEIAHFLECVNRGAQTSNSVANATGVLETALKARAMNCLSDA